MPGVEPEARGAGGSKSQPHARLSAYMSSLLTRLGTAERFRVPAFEEWKGARPSLASPPPL